jgi:TPP-dependent indolepyruvate ferredoxin oxidoreductase alpha subunit
MIEMGLRGIAMSRYSGCWVGMKVITETVETTAEIDLTDEMTPFVIPTDFEREGGLNPLARRPLAGSAFAGLQGLCRHRLCLLTRSTASPWIR